MHQKTTENQDAARQLADLTASYIDTLIADGWPEGAVLAGVHSGVMARTATKLGVEFAAKLSETTASELRGGLNA